MLYIKNIDSISLLCWGINYEDLTIDNLSKIELRFREETDLLCDINFLFEEYI